MLSFLSRARAPIAFAAIIGALLSPAAKAADMPFLPPQPVNDAPVEFGSGWYLRGDLGVSHVNNLNIDPALLSNALANNWTIGLGGGYQYNSWFRTELTADYESLYKKYDPGSNQTLCEIGAVGKPAGGPFTSSVPVNSLCTPVYHTRAEMVTLLTSAYLDLGNWAGFTPYVGAGVGANIFYLKNQVNWYQSNLAAYAGVTWTDPYTLGTYTANWDRAYSGTSVRFAYALMAGVAYDVSQHLKIDLGYRWLNLGRYDWTDRYGQSISKDLVLHQVRAGFRYMID